MNIQIKFKKAIGSKLGKCLDMWVIQAMLRIRHHICITGFIYKVQVRLILIHFYKQNSLLIKSLELKVEPKMETEYD